MKITIEIESIESEKDLEEAAWLLVEVERLSYEKKFWDEYDTTSEYGGV